MTRRPDLFASCVPAVLYDSIFYKFGDLYKKFHGNFWVALEPHLRAIAIAAAMIFVEIQTIFKQLSAIFLEDLNQLNSDLTPLLLY